MTPRRTAAWLPLALLLVAPSALAHGHMVAQVDVPAVAHTEAATYYLYQEGVFLSLWKETNGLLHGGDVTLPGLGHAPTGLQTFDACLLEDGTVKRAKDGACETGEFYPKDTRIGAGNADDEVLAGLLP